MKFIKLLILLALFTTANANPPTRHNDPCDGPNPPPGCDNRTDPSVPIDSFVPLILFSAILIGFYGIRYKTSRQK